MNTKKLPRITIEGYITPIWFTRRVDTNVDNNGCFIWMGALHTAGYGMIGQVSYTKERIAHRISYMLFKGIIPNNFCVHHICGNKLCVNPDHLEAISFLEHREKEIKLGNINGNHNKQFCKRGHEFTEENTYQHKRGRQCRECKNTYRKQYYIDTGE